MVEKIEKGWGHELVFARCDKYCGKLLVFSHANKSGSMHFHAKKQESWYVSQGSFILRKIDTRTAEIASTRLNVGDTVTHFPSEPHQLIALEDNSIIIEVSTHDDPDDSHRVMAGDSQR